MGKILFCTFAVAMCLGMTVLVAGTKGAQTNRSLNAHLALDGSFRDGLYVGRFTAEHRMPMLPPVGRWSAQRDRQAFPAGYHQGYSAVIEQRSPTKTNRDSAFEKQISDMR